MTDTASATKYHISKSGRIEPCGATVKPCPLGGQHFESYSKAEEFLAFEADVNLTKSANRRKASAPKQTWQTSAPLQRTSMSAGQRSAREVGRLIDSGDLTVNAPYQRGSVWSREQRVNLIASYLQGVPIPAVIINDRGTSAWEAATGKSAYGPGETLYSAIDGKQRIEATKAWFDSELPVPASWFEADDVAETIDTEDGPYVTFQGLTQRGQRLMSNRALLPVVEAKVASVQAEANLYLLVNGAGVAQSEADYERVEQIAKG